MPVSGAQQLTFMLEHTVTEGLSGADWQASVMYAPLKPICCAKAYERMSDGSVHGLGISALTPSQSCRHIGHVSRDLNG